jgi:hypothetical protein
VTRVQLDSRICYLTILQLLGEMFPANCSVAATMLAADMSPSFPDGKIDAGVAREWELFVQGLSDTGVYPTEACLGFLWHQIDHYRGTFGDLEALPAESLRARAESVATPERFGEIYNNLSKAIFIGEAPRFWERESGAAVVRLHSIEDPKKLGSPIAAQATSCGLARAFAIGEPPRPFWLFAVGSRATAVVEKSCADGRLSPVAKSDGTDDVEMTDTFREVSNQVTLWSWRLTRPEICSLSLELSNNGNGQPANNWYAERWRAEWQKAPAEEDWRRAVFVFGRVLRESPAMASDLSAELLGLMHEKYTWS